MKGISLKSHNASARKSTERRRSSVASKHDENTERGNWSGKLDFIMSCVGYAVGLGNIWRFPYLCYRNGGGAFLIPYIIFLLLCGSPLFFLELGFGQFVSLSPITIWQISPLFKGIGYGMVIISAVVCIYYNVIIAWTIYYIIMSLRSVVPWATCDNPWNTPACSHVTNGLTNDSYANTTALPEFYNATTDDISHFLLNGTMKRKSPSEEFWENHVLEMTEGIESFGTIRWQLALCLFASWVLVFICLIKGIKSSGKAMYFTALFPYVALIILLIRAVTLPGAVDGIKFYIIPQWHKLADLKVWGEAAMQIFYSMGVAWGALITMSSFNKFHHDCYRDARIIPFVNSGSSIFNGFVIFSIIGFMAKETNQEISQVVAKGPGLVFVVYPEAVAKLPLSPMWAVLFFMMLLSVGLSSQLAMFQTCISAFTDEFPEQLRSRNAAFTAAACFISFLMGIPCIMQGGIYFLQIMDWYSSTFSLMILSLTECLVIAWIYGMERFYKDVEIMIGYRPTRIYKAAWGVITPIIIMFLLGFSIISHSPVTYGDYEYPAWAIAIGWVFSLCSIIPLPIVAIIQLSRERGSLTQRVKTLVKPKKNYGPALKKHMDLYRMSLAGNHAGAMAVVKATLAGLPVLEDEEMIEKTLNPNDKEELDFKDSGYINEKNGYHYDESIRVEPIYGR